MRFYVWKIAEQQWRYSNLVDIACDVDTFAEAIAEASDLALLARPMEQTA